MIEKLHHYNCKLKRVVDGDTVEVIVDLGFDVSKTIMVRMNKIDTPEVNSSYGLEQKAAYKAELFLTQLIEGEDLIIHTKKNDLYGRYLGTLYVKGPHESVNINELMIKHGLAREYKGGRRKDWTDEELNRIINK